MTAELVATAQALVDAGKGLLGMESTG